MNPVSFLQRVMKIPIGFGSDFIYQFLCWGDCWAIKDCVFSDIWHILCKICDAKPYPGFSNSPPGIAMLTPPQKSNIEDVFPIEHWWIFQCHVSFQEVFSPLFREDEPVLFTAILFNSGWVGTTTGSCSFSIINGEFPSSLKAAEEMAPLREAIFVGGMEWLTCKN